MKYVFRVKVGLVREIHYVCDSGRVEGLILHKDEDTEQEEEEELVERPINRGQYQPQKERRVNRGQYQPQKKELLERPIKRGQF
jgi:hypothetical protein